MSKLFIIGNGFDGSHKMPTEYKHFRQYLFEQYDFAGDMDEMPEIPESYTERDGGVGFDHDAVVQLVVWMLAQVPELDSEWENFERALGELDYQVIMDEASWLLSDEDEFHEVYNFEDFSSELLLMLSNIQNYFSDWIKSVKIADLPKREVAELIEPDSMALSFNYTETLEVLYGMEQNSVCHIHGDRRRRSPLIIGHGSTRKSDFSRIHVAARDNVERIHEGIRKKPAENISRCHEFFDKISDRKSSIQEIYSYGFSFSDVDLPYIIEICRRLDTSGMIWYQNDYSKKDELDENLLKIKRCGFEGRFSTFHVES